MPRRGHYPEAAGIVVGWQVLARDQKEGIHAVSRIYHAKAAAEAFCRLYQLHWNLASTHCWVSEKTG